MIENFLHEHAALVSLLVLAGMFVGFARERMAASAIATIGAALFLALGYLRTEQALSVFSNGAVVTVASMLVLTAALVRTGVLEALAARTLRLAETRPKLATGAVYSGAVLFSSLVNSTPVVLVLIPIVRALAAALGTSTKRMLIPLSYLAILGGTCTLIGTSTNLLVDSLARAQGQPGFSIFSITPVGLVAAAAGMAFLGLVGRFLLPRENTAPEAATVRPAILTEVRILVGFEELGREYRSMALLGHKGVELVSALRNRDPFDVKADWRVEKGDRLILRVTEEELATLCETRGLRIGFRHGAESISSEQVMRVTLGANARAISEKLARAEPFTLSRVRILGVSRYANLAGPSLDEIVLRQGDRVWVAGDDEALERLESDPFLIASGRAMAKPFRRRRASMAIASLVGVVALSALGVMPIAGLAIIAIGLLLFTGAMEASDAWEAINGEVIVLIFAMLMVGTALQNTGAVKLVVEAVVPQLSGLPPFVVLCSIYFLTSLLTEMVSNSAVAVIMTPLVIALGAALGVDSRALLVAVMFGASASFATPIGYQTNTLVAAAGDYRFTDFLKIGVPMNIVVGIATCMAIAIFI